MNEAVIRLAIIIEAADIAYTEHLRRNRRAVHCVPRRSESIQKLRTLSRRSFRAAGYSSLARPPRQAAASISGFRLPRRQSTTFHRLTGRFGVRIRRWSSAVGTRRRRAGDKRRGERVDRVLSRSSSNANCIVVHCGCRSAGHHHCTPE